MSRTVSEGTGGPRRAEGPIGYVVEADGGSRGNPGVAGYGALVRDARSGRVLAQRAEPLGTASNNVAEYSGLIAGLELALRLAEGAPADVEVRMDSKLVVEQMSGRWKVKHEDMRRLADTAKTLVAGIAAAGGSCRFAWVPRARNTAADRLSNLAMDGRRIERLTPHPDDNPDDDFDDDPDQRPSGEPPAVPSSEPPPEPSFEPSSEPPSDRVSETPFEPAAGDPVAATVVGPATAPAPTSAPRRRPDRGAGARIVLVRHAVTDATAAGRMDGRGGHDLPLNAEGTRQAQLAATGARAFLGPVRPVVVASGLRRAQETGRHLAALFGTTVEVDPDWDELHFGDWNGRTMREIWAADPDGLTGLLADPTHARPGGESRTDLAARVARAAEAALRRAHEQDAPVLVVTHRGAIVAALAHLVGIDPRAAGRFETAPASLSSIRRWSDGEVLVEFVNDRSHLRRPDPDRVPGRP